MEGHTEKGKNADTHFTNFKERAESASVKMVTRRFETSQLREKSFRDKLIQLKGEIFTPSVFLFHA